MEDFKDVMLSEPPVRSHGGGGSHSAANYSGGPSGIGSFENYKGILLCERPTDQKVKRGPSEQPFLPPGAVDDTTMGLQPSLEAQRRHNVAKRHLAVKKVQNTAMNRHKKDLRALCEAKEKERLDAVEREMETEAKKARFKNQQSKLRGHMLGVRPAAGYQGTKGGTFVPGGYGRPEEEEESESGVLAAPVIEEAPEAVASALPPIPPPPVAYTAQRPTPPPGPPPDAVPPTPSTVRSSASSKKSSGSGGKKKKKKEKPLWAMTEEEAARAECRETDDLIKFAENLDFERFLDDYEVREALSIMRERVDELKEEEELERVARGEYEPPTRKHNRHQDDSSSVAGTELSSAMDLGDWDGGAGKRKKKRRAGVDPHAQDLEDGWDNYSTYSTLSDKKKKLISDEATRLAEKILQSSSTIRNVHTKQSLGKMLEELTHKAYNEERKPSTGGVAPPLGAGAPLGPPPVQPPAVAIHHPNQTVGDAGESAAPKRVLIQLQKSKDYVQNLPYMYRCPSI
eukprot:TRINITY_DN84766_c0_g1_i1.p1 TRINITY_DN84766_c0_g1~~TRINITY_DN84766_c0_g1_i1.p1  ORF type:complete len:513 (-),score=77.31 TRINITY_DN84766_c0_g1_i1:43-1581(-)